MSEHWEQVWIVPGNHYYHKPNRLLDINNISWQHKIYDNVIIGDNFSTKVDDYKLIMTTLWSLIPSSKYIEFKKRFVDFRKINIIEKHISTNHVKSRNDSNILYPKYYNEMHLACKSWLIDELADNDKCIVMSHTIPSMKLIDKKYNDGHELFAVDMETEILSFPQIKLWVHGHAHNFLDEEVGECRLVRNPHGLQHESHDYMADYVIEFKM